MSTVISNVTRLYWAAYDAQNMVRSMPWTSQITSRLKKEGRFEEELAKRQALQAAAMQTWNTYTAACAAEGVRVEGFGGSVNRPAGV